MRAATLAAVAIVAIGCSTTTSYERVPYDDLHLEVQAMDGWTLERQPGALVFVGDPAAYGERVTITIQSSKKLAPDVPNADASDAIIEATEVVLRGMPEAEVEPGQRTERAGMKAAYFDASFRPRNRSQRYERRHVVLIGNRRVFHLLHTAPAGGLVASADEFEHVVRSIRERG